MVDRKSIPRFLGEHATFELMNLQGFGCSAAGLAAKLWIAESTPAKSRGAFMGVLNSFYYVGQILASGIAVGLLSLSLALTTLKVGDYLEHLAEWLPVDSVRKDRQ